MSDKPRIRDDAATSWDEIRQRPEWRAREPREVTAPEPVAPAAQDHDGIAADRPTAGEQVGSDKRTGRERDGVTSERNGEQ